MNDISADDLSRLETLIAEHRARCSVKDWTLEPFPMQWSRFTPPQNPLLYKEKPVSVRRVVVHR